MSIVIKPIKDRIAVEPHWLPSKTNDTSPCEQQYDYLCLGTVIAMGPSVKNKLLKDHNLKSGDTIAYPPDLAYRIKIDDKEIHIINAIHIKAIIYKSKTAKRNKEEVISE